MLYKLFYCAWDVLFLCDCVAKLTYICMYGYWCNFIYDNIGFTCNSFNANEN